MGEDRKGPEWRKRSLWGALALVVLTGIALMKDGVDAALGPSQPAAAAAARERPSGETFGPVTAPKPLEFARAERVRIPSINVDAPVMNVGLDRADRIEVPPFGDSNMTGWYQNGVSPGQRGTSVVVGRVVNVQGPAVFHDLGSLREGRHIEVSRRDGKTVVFEVYGVEARSGGGCPGPRGYKETGRAELRLITCGAGSSKADGPEEHVVVLARMVKSR
ncbi:sortase domain-containing protein [Streptomyces sp. NPDC004726]